MSEAMVRSLDMEAPELELMAPGLAYQREKHLEHERVVRASKPVNKRLACCSGVYFLLQDDKVVYVGQSVNVLQRLIQHLQAPGAKVFNRWCFIPVPQEQLNAQEQHYIGLFTPMHNGFPGARGRTQ